MLPVLTIAFTDLSSHTQDTGLAKNNHHLSEWQEATAFLAMVVPHLRAL